MTDTPNTYAAFIRSGLAAGLTDDQVDFLWDFLAERIEKLKRNYVPVSEVVKGLCRVLETVRRGAAIHDTSNAILAEIYRLTDTAPPVDTQTTGGTDERTDQAGSHEAGSRSEAGDRPAEGEEARPPEAQGRAGATSTSTVMFPDGSIEDVPNSYLEKPL